MKSTVYLAKYRYNARAAATISWDDGSIEDVRLVALLNRLGIKGTFSIAPGLLHQERRLSTWGEVWKDRYRRPGFPLGFLAKNEIAQVYRGHEVAAHTMNHPDLTRLSFEQILEEARSCKAYLESVLGYPVVGFVYPHGRYNRVAKDAVRQAGFLYARTTSAPRGWGVPSDLMALHPIGNWRYVSKKTFLKVYRARGVFHIYGHGYEMRRNSDWTRLRTMLGWMAGSGCWCATLGDIISYRQAVSMCSVSQIGSREWQVNNGSDRAVTVVVRKKGWIFLDGQPADFGTAPGWLEVPPGVHTISLERSSGL